MDDKPFMTVDEQLRLLERRGLKIDDPVRAAALLLRDNYYVVVNGYKSILIDKERSNLAKDDRYIEGASFSQLELLVMFDKNLRNVTMPILLEAENSIKTAVVYSFCRFNQDSDAYLDPASYCSRDDYSNRAYYTKGLIRLLSTLQGIRDNRPRKPYIDHYVHKHNCLPLWVASKCMTFGNVSAFFDFQKQNVKTMSCVTLARALGVVAVRQKALEYALHTLPAFRNICAHDERFYCTKVGKQSDKGFAQLLRSVKAVVRDAEYQAYIAKVKDLIVHVNEQDAFIGSKILGGMGMKLEDFD